MAWEKRGSQYFYYRSKRVNGRVVKIYYGTGRPAQITYEQDLRQQEAKERERVARKGIEALDLQTDTLANMTRTITRAHLLLAGYHQHKRTWRRKRTVTQQEGQIMTKTLLVEPETLETLENVLIRGMKGEHEVLPAIKQLLDNAPAIWQEAFNITKKVEGAWIQTIAGQDLLTREMLERQVADLKRTLLAEFSSLLESLAIGTIATCFLSYKQAELAAAEQLKRYGNALTQAQENHLTACQKRYFAAIRELARIRQLLTPKTTTIVNVADTQQVNVS